MAYFTNKRTSAQQAIGYAFIPFCLAYVLWLVWPIISLISFWVKNDAPDFGFGELIAGFDWSIFWKMYLLAYVIGFVLLLGIKMLAGGRISLVWGRFNLEGILWTVFLYPIYVIREMYTFVTCDTNFAGTLGSLLQAIIKGGVLYLMCAFPSSVLFGTASFKDWFADVPLMLMFAGIILLIWVFDQLWFWDKKGTVGMIISNVLYYVAVLSVIGLTVYGCVTVLGNLYTDYSAIATQLTPVCLPLTLLVFYTFYFGWNHNDWSGSYFAHILPLLVGLGLSFLGAYLITVTKVLFFVMLAIPFGLTVWFLVLAKGLPCHSFGTSAKTRRAFASALALGGGGSSGGGTNAPVNQSLPEDKSCEQLRKRLNSSYWKSGSDTFMGFTVSYTATLTTCRQGVVVWSVSISTKGGSSTVIGREVDEDTLRSAKANFEKWLRDETTEAIEDLAKHYKTYGGSWSITVRI